MATHVPVLIIGAGISGLVCAYALRKSGIHALLVESSDRPGGVIRSERRDGYLLEFGPQSFSSTPQLLDLCRDLGLHDQLVEAPPRAPRYLLINGRLRPAPLNPPAFFASSLFSAKTKWSLLRDAFGRTTPPSDGDESIAAFTRRKFTSELLDKLVGPFVSGIYAGDPEKLSLRAAFPQLYEAERASGSIIRGMLRTAKAAKSGPGSLAAPPHASATSLASNSSPAPAKKRRPTLQSFRDGNATLVNALAASLGSALRTETCAATFQISTSPAAPGSSGKFSVTLSGKNPASQVTADNLVLATPSDVTASLLRPLSSDVSAALEQIAYAPVAVVSLGYPKSAIRHSLEGFGFLIPRSENLRTLGTVWNSSLFANRAPDGHVLLTSFVGGATDPAIANLSPGEVSALVHRELSSILQIQSAPAFSNVTHYARALPQYNLGHTEHLSAVQKACAAVPGMFLAGNYFRGPAIGACVEQSIAVANEIRARLAQGTQGG